MSEYRVDEGITISKDGRYFEYYVIKKGDTLYDIARRYNINPDLLASLNGLNNDDYIYPEQTILIPKSNYSYYITKKGDTLRFRTNPDLTCISSQQIWHY